MLFKTDLIKLLYSGLGWVVPLHVGVNIINEFSLRNPREACLALWGLDASVHGVFKSVKEIWNEDNPDDTLDDMAHYTWHLTRVQKVLYHGDHSHNKPPRSWKYSSVIHLVFISHEFFTYLSKLLPLSYNNRKVWKLKEAVEPAQTGFPQNISF